MDNNDLHGTFPSFYAPRAQSLPAGGWNFTYAGPNLLSKCWELAPRWQDWQRPASEPHLLLMSTAFCTFRCSDACSCQLQCQLSFEVSVASRVSTGKARARLLVRLCMTYCTAAAELCLISGWVGADLPRVLLRCSSMHVLCSGPLPASLYAPQLATLELRNSTVRATSKNSRGEYLPEWCAQLLLLLLHAASTEAHAISTLPAQSHASHASACLLSCTLWHA